MNITVIGAGVSGLSCAIRLLERGHRVQVHADRRTPHTTSDRSAAAFTPFRGSGGEGLRRWTRDAYARFVELAERAEPTCGVRLAWMSEFFFEPLAEMPWWSDLVGGVEVIERVPSRYAAGLRMRMPTMDMTLYMPWLEQRVMKLGGNIVEEHVVDLHAPFRHGADVVVNASGLGARALAHDDAMQPMRGQVMHVANDIALEECFADSGRGSTSTYVFPFERHIVLGGTCEVGIEEATTDEKDLSAILDRCRTMLRETGHARWSDLGRTRIKAWSGLRPARVVGEDDAAIRLELERLDGELPVVHDYGHSRMGVTLSWGCADEVARLVTTLR
jgi:D-amino-acid oxidase